MPKYRVTRGKIGRLEDGQLRQYGPGLSDIDPATNKEVDMSIIEMDKVQAVRYMSQLEEMPGQYDPVTVNVEVKDETVPVGAKVETGQLEPVKTEEKTSATTTTTTPTTPTTSSSGAWNGDVSTIGDHTAPDIIAYIQSSKSADAVIKVVDAEKSGRNRKGIIAAGEDKLSSFK